jgi:hypothetical protein
LICPSTRRLTGGHFDYRDLGPLALKGWAEPVRVWQVLATSGVESRFKAMHKTKLLPLFDQEQARMLELRAATDLARLWMNQGKRAEARDVLASIYGRLTEGFDTRDLTEAKAVLAQLQ